MKHLFQTHLYVKRFVHMLHTINLLNAQNYIHFAFKLK